MSMVTRMLDQALRRKQPVTIRLQNGRFWTGTLIDVTEETVRFQPRNGEEQVWQVSQVEMVQEATI